MPPSQPSREEGAAPKIEDALAISGEVSPAATAAHENARGLFRKAGFALQDQTVVSGNGYELTLVPSIETYEEWQGTAICTKYDEQGNVLERYTANIVSFADSQGNPIIKYQVNYSADGTPYLSHGPGMYSGYALGTLYQDHQALYGTPLPLEPESWQFLTPEDEQLYYDSYPQPQQPPGGERQPPVRKTSQRGTAAFLRAGFAPPQTRQDRHIERHQMRCGTPARPEACGPGIPTLGRYLNHTAAGCATAALCGSNVRFRAVACVGSFISNLPVLFGW